MEATKHKSEKKIIIQHYFIACGDYSDIWMLLGFFFKRFSSHKKFHFIFWEALNIIFSKSLIFFFKKKTCCACLTPVYECFFFPKCLLGVWGSFNKRESSSWAACRDAAVGRRTSRRGKETQTMQALSSLLHADPRLSIRESLSRGGDIPRRPTAFKHLLLSPLAASVPPHPSPNQGGPLCSCSCRETKNIHPPQPSRGDEGTGILALMSSSQAEWLLWN